MSSAVLAGVRVLDFGRYIAGPYCAALLGYLGADVIRIERRAGGEDRFIAPVTAAGEGAVFLQANCNKRSLTLDLTKPQAQAVLRRLVASADIVVANLPAPALQSLGLDFATLSAIKPDIILSTQTAFGDAGPYHERGGFDGVGQALSGAMYMSGIPGRPVKAAAPYVDYCTAVLSAFGVLAALLHKRQSGEGQEVKGTLLATALAVFNSHLIEQGVTAINRIASGNRVQTSAPSDVFQTLDGHLLTHVVGNGLFRRWARLMGAEERWADDPLYRTDQSRADHSEPILACMRAWCAERTTHEAITQLQQAGLPAGEVNTLQQALDDPQVAAMQFLHAVSDYPGLPRAAPVADLPIEILLSLGYTPAEIDALRAAAII